MELFKKRKGALGGPLAVFVEVVLGLVVIGALLIFGPVLIGNTMQTTAPMLYSDTNDTLTAVNTTGNAMIALFGNIPNYLSLVIMAIVFGVAIWAIVAYLGRTGGERV